MVFGEQIELNLLNNDMKKLLLKIKHFFLGHPSEYCWHNKENKIQCYCGVIMGYEDFIV
jgi:hypothetical protein